MIEWEDGALLASEEQIQRFEKDTRISVPPQYRTFLMTISNGGRPAEDFVYLINEKEGESDIHGIYGVDHPEDCYNLASNIEAFPEDYNESHFGFGYDSLGNALLLIGEAKGDWSVHFRDHELRKDGTRSMFRMADSFDQFIDSLHRFVE